MIKMITHRIGWKILSLVLAFLLWFLVVNYEDPYITKSFHVDVEKLNAFDITSQDKSIDYKDGEYVDLVVRGKRSIVDNMTKSDLTAYADLSNVSFTGAIEIEVDTPEGITVISKDPVVMKIELEDIKHIQKEIQYLIQGEPAEGYIVLESSISLSPNRVLITGPESKVSLVSSAIVSVNLDEGDKEDISMYGNLQLLDNNKNEVEGVTANVEKVQVSIPIQKTKTVPIVFKSVESIPEGYRLSNIDISLANASIRGEDDALANISKIEIDTISLAEIKESKEYNINLNNLLPEGVYIADDNIYTKVSLTVEQLVQKEIAIKPQDITVRNLPAGLKFSYVNEDDIVLKLEGTQKELDKVTVSSLDPYIRLLGLDAQEHEVVIKLTLPTNVQLISDTPLLKIVLVKEEAETNTASQPEINTESAPETVENETNE